MPVNYQQALQQIRAMGKQAPMIEQRLRATRNEVAAQLKRMSCELDTLEQLVLRAAASGCCSVAAQAYRQQRCCLGGLR